MVNIRSVFEEINFEKLLESVTKCPVCLSVNRRSLYSGLSDNIFFSKGSDWTLKECSDCGIVYLDPRYKRDFLYRAYENYYTHSSDEALKRNRFGIIYSQLRRKLSREYKIWKYVGGFGFGSSTFGVLVAHIFPFLKSKLDRECRYLPKCDLSSNKLLDIGCGDGAFLTVASEIGWDAVGLDNDHKAVKNAISKGVRAICGNVLDLNSPPSFFDALTLSHVIEHVSDPRDFLRECTDLLKPGGFLWLETPNINSLGRNFFGRDWRGLEPPRHLVIFNHQVIKNILLELGYVNIKFHRAPNQLLYMFKHSQIIRNYSVNNQLSKVPIKMYLKIIIASIIEAMQPQKREFISLTANKSVKLP